MMEVQHEDNGRLDHDTPPCGSTERDNSAPAPRKRGTHRAGLRNAPSHVKHQRVSQACNQCRSRKEKCDGQHPACASCISIQQTCLYGSNSRRRGLPAGYVRALEVLWGRLFHKVAGSEDLVHALLSRTNENGHPDWLIIVEKDGEDVESMLKVWRKSRACNIIQRLLTTMDDNMDEERRSEGTNAQLSEHEQATIPLVWHNIALPEDNLIRDIGGREFPPGEKANTVHDTLITSDTGIDHAFRLSSASRLVPSSLALPYILPPNCWCMLEVYFTFTHCWFPILEKHDILRAAHASFGKTLYVDDLRSASGEHAALWAVLTYASTQGAAVNTYSSSMTDSGRGSLSSEEMYLRARSLVPSEDSEFCLAHVQALLLLGLYKLGSGSKNAAWLLIGHAVRVAVMIGMEGFGNSRGTIEAPPSVTNRSHHVFLGCFVLDTLISSSLGKLPYLKSEWLSSLRPLLEDGIEEWDLWVNTVDQEQGLARSTVPERRPLHTLSVFNELVKLYGILNDVLHVSPCSIEKVPQYSLFQERLADWHDQLPKHCRFSTTVDLSESTNLPMLPHIWNLRLMYTSTLAMFQTRNLQCQQTSPALKGEAYSLIKSSTSMIMELLKQYKAFFGASLMPAPFVYYLHLVQIAIECYGGKEATFKFKLHFHKLLLEMKRTWPGTESLDSGPVPFSGNKTDQNATNSSRREVRAVTGCRKSPFNPRQPQADEDQRMPGPQKADEGHRRLRNPPDVTAPHGTSTSAIPEDCFVHSSEDVDSTMKQSTAARSHLPDTSVTGLGSLQDFSLFDELASLDGAEGLDTQPHFMQNLGFRPNNVSSDFLSLYNFLDFAEMDGFTGNG